MFYYQLQKRVHDDQMPKRSHHYTWRTVRVRFYQVGERKMPIANPERTPLTYAFSNYPEYARTNPFIGPGTFSQATAQQAIAAFQRVHQEYYRKLNAGERNRSLRFQAHYRFIRRDMTTEPHTITIVAEIPKPGERRKPGRPRKYDRPAPPSPKAPCPFITPRGKDNKLVPVPRIDQNDYEQRGLAAYKRQLRKQGIPFPRLAPGRKRRKISSTIDHKHLKELQRLGLAPSPDYKPELPYVIQRIEEELKKRQIHQEELYRKKSERIIKLRTHQIEQSKLDKVFLRALRKGKAFRWEDVRWNITEEEATELRLTTYHISSILDHKFRIIGNAVFNPRTKLAERQKLTMQKFGPTARIDHGPGRPLKRILAPFPEIPPDPVRKGKRAISNKPQKVTPPQPVVIIPPVVTKYYKAKGRNASNRSRNSRGAV